MPNQTKQQPTSCAILPRSYGQIRVHNKCYNGHSGIVFSGVKTKDSRFPYNAKNINTLKQMGAVYMVQQKQWFIATQKANQHKKAIHKMLHATPLKNKPYSKRLCKTSGHLSKPNPLLFIFDIIVGFISVPFTIIFGLLSIFDSSSVVISRRGHIGVGVPRFRTWL